MNADKNQKIIGLICFLLTLLICVHLCSSVALSSDKPKDQPTRITKQRDFLQHLSWSPDGKKFLFTRIHKGQMGLWTCNADGGELKRLLPEGSMPHFDGHWSPDGKKVIFVFDKLQGTDGKLQIDVINADGTEHK